MTETVMYGGFPFCMNVMERSVSLSYKLGMTFFFKSVTCYLLTYRINCLKCVPADFLEERSCEPTPTLSSLDNDELFPQIEWGFSIAHMQ